MRFSRLSISPSPLAIATLLICSISLTSAIAAPITYGSLSNFDVINDTGQACNGFEIELEGISPGDVVYTFGDTGGPNPVLYIRYGKPTILPNATGTGSIVRYASHYDAVSKQFTDATPAAVSPYPVTMGHQCWIYGDPAHYPGSGCEHFGVSLVKNPTKTTYRWLIGDNTTGTLKVAGTIGSPNIPAPVNVPAPIWNVSQNPPPSPGAPPIPVVIAVVQAPPAPPLPPSGAGQWGDAIWMKIYKTELPGPVELDDLVLGGNVANPVPNPDVDPPEIEWQLLQSPPIGKMGIFEKSENGGEVQAGNEAVSRRYEFYKYTGQYDQDPDNLHEAFCDNPIEVAQQTPARCGTPDANGVAGVGDLIGAQNAALNLVPLCAADVSGSVSLKRSGYLFDFKTKLFSQKITLTNTGNTTVYGPLSLVLDNLNLSAPDGLYDVPSGVTSCTAPQNSPYFNLISTSDMGLPPGNSISVVLKFSDATKKAITYSTRVLSTSGSR